MEEKEEEGGPGKTRNIKGDGKIGSLPTHTTIPNGFVSFKYGAAKEMFKKKSQSFSTSG
jgi:hypothetical protein